MDEPPQNSRRSKKRVCACGCGGITGGYFQPGHDSTVKSKLNALLKGEAKLKECNAAIRALWKLYQNDPSRSLVSMVKEMRGE